MHVVAWIAGVKTIHRQTMATYGCMPESVIAGLRCGLDCSPAVCDAQRRCSWSMRLVKVC